MKMKLWLRQAWFRRKTWFLILVPLLLIPLPVAIQRPESYSAYVIVIMAFYWITEALPLAVTGLIPVILFPWLGIMRSVDVTNVFFPEATWLGIGGLILGISMEESNLHKRIALRILILFGTKPKLLLLGFMTASFFFSMWISNTATTAMMLPLMDAVFSEVKQKNKKKFPEVIESHIVRGTSFSSKAFEVSVNKIENKAKETKNLAKAISLCIPYSASIGGMATLNGTLINIFLVIQIDQFFPGASRVISYSRWIIYCFPVSLIMLILSYLWLCWLYIGYEWSEGVVLVVFLSTALLWFFRDPGFIPGWSVLFPEGFITDGTVSITMSFLFFLIPKKRPNLEFLFGPANFGSDPVLEPILSWKTFQRKFPWNLLFLFGGGLSMAEGAAVSGLSTWVGGKLSAISNLEPWLIVLIATVVVCFVTQCTGNGATVLLFKPIFFDLATTSGIHPLYIALPSTLAASLAFMLPIATASNAIAISFGRITAPDLVKAGWGMSLLGIGVINLFINTYGVSYFGLNEFPSWASVDDVTTGATSSSQPFNVSAAP